jgi:hypothetical protein
VVGVVPAPRSGRTCHEYLPSTGTRLAPIFARRSFRHVPFCPTSGQHNQDTRAAAVLVFWSRNTGQLRAFKLRLNAGNGTVWRWRYEHSRLPWSWRCRWDRGWAVRGRVLLTLYDRPRFGEEVDAGLG